MKFGKKVIRFSLPFRQKRTECAGEKKSVILFCNFHNLIFISVLILFNFINHCESSVIFQSNDIVNYTIYSDKLEFRPINEDLNILDVKCKEKSSNIAQSTKRNNFTCEKLEPCTEYSVQIKYKTKINKEIQILRLELKTEYSRPEASLDLNVPNNDSIFLSWNTNHSECIENYFISISTTNFSETISLNNNDNNNINNFSFRTNYYDLKNLEPCSKYDLTFSVYDIKGNLITNESFSMNTDVTNPGQVIDVQMKYLPNNVTEVSWNPPKYKSCVLYYYLKWAELNCINTDPEKCTWSYHKFEDIDGRSYSLENLKGCTSYIFTITPNGEQLNNQSKSINFISAEDVPGPVVDLNRNGTYPTNLTLIWKPPVENENCTKFYQVILQENFDDKTIIANETEDTSITFYDLQPCGEYNISVYAVSITGSNGKMSNISLITDKFKPSVIQNVIVEPYPTEILIKWDKPEIAYLCVKKYRITGWPADEHSNENYQISLETDEKKITISELVACMRYTFQIIPALENLDGDHYHFDAETKPMRAKAPEKLETKSVLSDGLELLTVDSDESNRCETLYAKFSCESKNATIEYAEEIVTGALSKFTSFLHPLSPYTLYYCNVSLYNIFGWSEVTSALLQTAKYYPEIPESINILPISNKSINIQWKEPKHANGEFLIYKVYIQTVGPRYKIPSHCSKIKLNSYTQTIEAQSSWIFEGGLPFVEYSIQVAAKNDYGMGQYSAPQIITTKSWVPEPVEKLSVKSIIGPNIDSPYKSAVTLKWLLPCRANSKIVAFEGNLVGTRSGHDNHLLSWVLYVNDTNRDQEEFQLTEDRLKPEFNYTVSIVVHTNDIFMKSERERVNFLSPAGFPARINITGLGEASSFASSNPTTSAVVSFSDVILYSDMGEILYAALLLSEMECQPDPDLRSEKLDSLNDWPEIASWYEVQSQKCITQYQTTPIRWSPFRHLQRHYNNTEENGGIQYTIGTENCSDKIFYCNGALKTNTRYKLVIRLFTRSGYSDTAALEFKTDSVVPLYYILLLVVICLLLSFILGILYLGLTKRIIWRKDSLNAIDEQSGDISVKNFLQHYGELSKLEKLQREFKDLTSISNDLHLTNTASKSNESKNRYSNIFPYDKNRVILDPDLDGSDYINASFINGYKHRKEYIATQGPKPETFTDFWKMVLQQNVRIIVMVTQLREGDQVKCHQYFPLFGQEMRIGANIRVNCKKETIYDTFDRREMIVENSDDEIEQKVIHYYFKGWPDHACPSDPNDLINFVRKVKSEKRPSHSPIIIHCSAGVGRTGTFIGLDIMMQKMKHEGKINTFETVKELRFQRMKMVQTIQQYEFLYNCAFQLVKKKFKMKKESLQDDEIRLSMNHHNNDLSNRRRSGTNLQHVNDTESVT